MIISATFPCGELQLPVNPGLRKRRPSTQAKNAAPGLKPSGIALALCGVETPACLQFEFLRLLSQVPKSGPGAPKWVQEQADIELAAHPERTIRHNGTISWVWLQ